nr:hypothetical protein Iba_chr11bCG12810 [Ipomoea batatas]
MEEPSDQIPEMRYVEVPAANQILLMTPTTINLGNGGQSSVNESSSTISLPLLLVAKIGKGTSSLRREQSCGVTFSSSFLRRAVVAAFSLSSLTIPATVDEVGQRGEAGRCKAAWRAESSGDDAFFSAPGECGDGMDELAAAFLPSTSASVIQ